MADTTHISEAQAFDYNNSEFLKQQQNLDFFSFASPSDVAAPHPDLFESDIDSNLAGFDQLQLYTVDSNDAYNFFRTSKSQWQGPLSTITVSSDSYDSVSAYSESFNSESFSKHSDKPVDLFDFTDLDMDFQRVNVGSDYSAVAPSLHMLDDAHDPTSFGALPPTPPTSPPAKLFERHYGHSHRSSYSDYSIPRRKIPNNSGSDYYPSMAYTPASIHPSVSPAAQMINQLPNMAAVPPQQPEESKDPRKKYRCTACPRAFARAYNLKTHMATHDPNRLKPYVCPQRSCGRSFSRKHDLGRHLISIHRDEAVSSSLLPGTKKAFGVESGTRSWCDTCGKSYVGRTPSCNCVDVK
ncbi:hypothetical protein CPB83DRAFT_865751 [Crepidotus variabilis]|uniref:C2H2-type domain-containing protein n=1 Tax=Crepidotus variabilis TaxID=179855 RepID=A0A9P6JX51_9AGAR|nr:hypothetical protein CPB83DRAFT_865751 [Crepidotus variabilis]